MKYIFILFLLLGVSLELFAQQPSKFSYQFRVITNANLIVSQQKVSVRVNILQGNINGNSVYEEIHQVTTNLDGLGSIQIGGGASNFGDFSKINWSLGNYFIKTETDPNGGSNYTLINSNQLLSVPFALYAENVIGTKGEKGDIGNAGPQGLQGDTGLPGVVGPKGFIGNSGEAGIKGVQGDVGIKGEQGTSVFSTGVNKGDMFYWDGTSWQLIPIGSNGMKLMYCDTTLTWSNGFCKGKISSIDCDSFKQIGNFYSEISSSGIIKIPYFGGNGGFIEKQSINSNDILGLTATLNATLLKNGSDTLEFKINGIPSNFGTASFNFTILNHTCTFKLNVRPSKGYGEDINDVSGWTYKTVYIGTQQWMESNLKTYKYNDGSVIMNSYSWKYKDTCYYASLSTAFSNGQFLYNWYAVSPKLNGNRNVCPVGWHVPSSNEWTVLIDYLGKDSAGVKMKRLDFWKWSKRPTNSSLFTGIPYGCKDPAGTHKWEKTSALWWCSDDINLIPPKSFNLTDIMDGSSFGNFDKNYLLSIRCIKD